MSIKKSAAIAAAVAALAAISVPAMALENEFHGMYRAFAYLTNTTSGGAAFNLADGSKTDKYIEQRARIQYIAKASDDLKLVTHFELDTKFGGQSSTKYPIGDAGGIDADRITLETKNVYLDFNCPITGSNVKVGIQPFNDAYQGTFSNFDGTGVVISKKFDKLTGTYGYFTINSDAGNQFATTALLTAPNTAANGTKFPSYKTATDLNVVDVKYAVSKDITVGANYYDILSGTSNLFLNMLGVNVDAKAGPAAVTASLGYQFGDSAATISQKIRAFGATAAAKVAVGSGKANVSALYLSGDKTTDTKNTGWQVANPATTYFPAANMWLITRNAATINSSSAIGGSTDITRGGRGIMGMFAGYEGAVDKMFYNANVGYAQVAQKQTADSAAIGTEFNVTVGYKLYSNLSVSATGAYAVLGDGYGKNVAPRVTDAVDTNTHLLSGVAKNRNADNPFMTNIALNYAF